MENLLTVAQVAHRLQLTTWTIREQLKDGRLRGVKRGKQWRVPESALFESPHQVLSSPQVEKIWADMTSRDGERQENGLKELIQAPEPVRIAILNRSAKVVARYYATPEGLVESSQTNTG